MSTYRVIGQIKFLGESAFATNTTSFTDFTKASDYYSNVFKDVSSDMSEIGGEFVITLLRDTDDDQQVEVIRRQVLSTTKHDSDAQNN